MTEHKQKLEFGGVPGNLAMIIGLPLFTAYLFFAVRFNDGRLFPGSDADWSGFAQAMVPTGRAAVIYGVWFVFQALLQKYAPGRQVLGAELPDGSRLPYRMNGLLSLIVTFLVVAMLHWSGLFSIGELYEQFGALISVMTIFVFLFSIYLYWYGKQHGQARHLSGRFIHDFWMGTGHNPRVPPGPEGLDLKIFCEARPGLILWVLINTSFAYVQYERYGFVSTSMVLVWLFQMFYIVDYFWNEEAILTTMDIKHENFGFMLAFGDLVWVPMTYCLQAHYLIDRVHSLPWWGAALIVAINMLGLYIFRAVNLQKHKFRNDPDVRIWGKKPEYIQTAQGGKLLLSGFWGWSRHFNYVGDILMALSWSLPCLFDSLLPYFYPIYFAILLIHRERRDHNFCSRKYGADWDRYCERVRWRIIPGLY